jgi:hypothetical protein
MRGLLTAVILDSRNVFVSDDSRMTAVIIKPPSDIPFTLKLLFLPVYCTIPVTDPPPLNPVCLQLICLDVLTFFHPSGKWEMNRSDKYF